MLPSSFSLSALRSNSDSDDVPRKNILRNKSVDLSHIQLSDAESPRSVGQHVSSPEMHDYALGSPTPRPELRKTKTWSNRLSTFLPSLMSPVADPSQAVLRKPIATTRETPPSTATTPPPPYNYHESANQGSSITLINEPANGDEAHEPNLYVAYGVPTIPPILTGLDTSPIDSFNNPQVMEPSPTTPEGPRGVLKKQQSPTNHRSSLVEDALQNIGTARKPSRLQKDHPVGRPRSNSGHASQPPHPPQIPMARHTLPSAEPRGRSVSAQSPAVTQNRMSGPRVASASNALQPDSQSPSRGRARRSWLPGGGRSRSSSADVRNAKGKRGSAPPAWVMSDDGGQAEYNTLFLSRGEKVHSMALDLDNI
jgi:hypothetical protein